MTLRGVEREDDQRAQQQQDERHRVEQAEQRRAGAVSPDHVVDHGPYAVRAKPGAPVSAPCTWDEVESGNVGPRTFTLRNMAARVEDVGDLWSGMRRRRRSLQRPLPKLKLSKVV